MKRVYVSFVIVGLALWVPIAANSQGVLFGPSQDALSAGGFNLLSSARVGYQKLAVNLSLPVPFTDSFLALESSSALDFKLLDAGVWVGGVDVEVRRGGFAAFGSVEASLPKNARVDMASEPFWAGYHSVGWAASNLSWWAVDAGAAMGVQDSFEIEGGLKIEKWALTLDSPVDPIGWIQEWQSVYGDRYTADFRTTLVIAYLGVRLRSPYFSACLRLSPFALGDVSIPLRYLFNDSPLLVAFEEARYTFRRSGFWMEGTVRSGVQFTGSMICNIWLKANWLQMRGNGNEDYRMDAWVLGTPIHILSNAGSASGHYRSSAIAGGVEGVLNF